MAESQYRFTISLNVLNHLGINLYSNVPAVLAEAVANAWDADAEKVVINIDGKGREITIADDGHGMDQVDANKKYLTVGYQRRLAGAAVTDKHKRPVMGRKGIGKLSLFSIANEIEVQSVKDSAKCGFLMNVAEIKNSIKKEGKAGVIDYQPKALPLNKITIAKGTKITLRKLNKRVGKTVLSLRRRLARRFAVIDKKNKFSIIVNKKPITVADRDYLKKVEYLWTYGKVGPEKAACKKLVNHEARPSAINKGKYKVGGWIGTVANVGALRDHGDTLNKIVVMFRGRVAQEDVLESLGLTGMFTKYVLGEIQADFLDTDKDRDIATTSRQMILEDDPRYVSLRKYLKAELAHIRSEWNRFKEQSGTDVANEIPEIEAWFTSLKPDARRRAQNLFGKINQVPVESEKQRRTLLSHAVLAFESFRYKENLDALDSLTPETLMQLGPIFEALDDIEATLYHRIVKERVEIIRALRRKVSKDAKERVIQDHLFKHLWLLDPAWERATGTEYMEQTVDKEFKKIDAKLTREELAGRIDIKYATASGKHIIVELKRAGRVVSSEELLAQVNLYRVALRKLLKTLDKDDPCRIEVVCVVGRPLSDWAEENGRQESDDMLASKHVRVVLYQELIENAYRQYKKYLDHTPDTSRVLNLVAAIEGSGEDSADDD